MLQHKNPWVHFIGAVRLTSSPLRQHYTPSPLQPLSPVRGACFCPLDPPHVRAIFNWVGGGTEREVNGEDWQGGGGRVGRGKVKGQLYLGAVATSGVRQRMKKATAVQSGRQHQPPPSPLDLIWHKSDIKPLPTSPHHHHLHPPGRGSAPFPQTRRRRPRLEAGPCHRYHALTRYAAPWAIPCTLAPPPPPLDQV